jgi:hypothetical protein
MCEPFDFSIQHGLVGFLGSRTPLSQLRPTNHCAGRQECYQHGNNRRFSSPPSSACGWSRGGRLSLKTSAGIPEMGKTGLTLDPELVLDGLHCSITLNVALFAEPEEVAAAADIVVVAVILAGPNTLVQSPRAP